MSLCCPSQTSRQLAWQATRLSRYWVLLFVMFFHLCLADSGLMEQDALCAPMTMGVKSLVLFEWWSWCLLFAFPLLEPWIKRKSKTPNSQILNLFIFIIFFFFQSQHAHPGPAHFLFFDLFAFFAF